MRRAVAFGVVLSAVVMAFAAAPLGAVVSTNGVHAGVFRAAPSKKQKTKTKTKTKSKAVTFTVTGTFEGKTYNGKASSTTVRCFPSGDFFNGQWAGTVGGSQFSINFETRTGGTPPPSGANTASLIVNSDQQNGLGADNPTITLASTQKSGAFDAQFVESGSSANSIHIKGPFKCTSQ